MFWKSTVWGEGKNHLMFCIKIPVQNCKTGLWQWILNEHPAQGAEPHGAVWAQMVGSNMHLWICWCRWSSTVKTKPGLLLGCWGRQQQEPCPWTPKGSHGWRVKLSKLSPEPPHWWDCTNSAATPEQELPVWAKPRFCLCQPHWHSWSAQAQPALQQPHQITFPFSSQQLSSTQKIES